MVSRDQMTDLSKWEWIVFQCAEFARKMSVGATTFAMYGGEAYDQEVIDLGDSATLWFDAYVDAVRLLEKWQMLGVLHPEIVEERKESIALEMARSAIRLRDNPEENDKRVVKVPGASDVPLSSDLSFTMWNIADAEYKGEAQDIAFVAETRNGEVVARFAKRGEVPAAWVYSRGDVGVIVVDAAGDDRCLLDEVRKMQEKRARAA